MSDAAQSENFVRSSIERIWGIGATVDVKPLDGGTGMIKVVGPCWGLVCHAFWMPGSGVPTEADAWVELAARVRSAEAAIRAPSDRAGWYPA